MIDDQTFDSFASFENINDPLKFWTSSREEFDQKFEVHTFFAVLAVLVGYIMQFIGLRGMSTWVSLTQLGATIIMSMLRGSLRMQRLNRDANMLKGMPDMIAGYELDWLAFEIAQQRWQQEAQQNSQMNSSKNLVKSSIKDRFGMLLERMRRSQK